MSVTDHLAAAAAHLRAVDLTELSAGDVAVAMGAVQEVGRVARAIGLDLAALAHAADTARQEGAASTQSWLAQTEGVTHREAARELKLATDLQTIAPRTRQAMRLPGMSADKARVIAGAMTSLPATLDDTERARVEDDLVERARRHSVDDLRRAAKRAVEVLDADWADRLEADTLAKEESQAHRVSDFWMRPTDVDGMVEGGFTVPQLEADMLRSALESFTAPRHDCTSQPDETSDLLDERPTYRHRLGRAFTAILGHLPTDELGNHGGVAATLVVTTDYDTLADAVERAGTTSHGTRVSPDTVRQLACSAGILPVVMGGGGSRVMAVGRTRRLYSRAQRVALALRDGGCAFPGCDRPPGWCEAHHVTPWAAGGHTEMHDGVLLCAQHHRVIHHTDWQVRISSQGRPEFIPPATVDPQQRPRHDDRWRPTRGASDGPVSDRHLRWGA